MATAHDATAPTDPWSEWLLGRRHGGDPEQELVLRAQVERIRDRVLEGARLSPGKVLVDVGAGDGLIGLGALERLGPRLKVVFADVSARLLQRAEQRAVELGLRDCCTFLQTPADRMEGVADESADILTCRAVLAYLADRTMAFRQFYRVIKPGGNLSIGEPIYQDEAMQLVALTRYLESRPADGRTTQARLHQRWKAAQLPSTTEKIFADPLTSFNERGLIALCQSAGFGQIHLELHIDVRKAAPLSWETFINTAPRPRAPTLREILELDFNEEERRQLEEGLRPLVESGQVVGRDAIAYLIAVKPG